MLGLERIVRLMGAPNDDLGKPGEHPRAFKITPLGAPEPDCARTVRPSWAPGSPPTRASLLLELALLAHPPSSLWSRSAEPAQRGHEPRTIHQERPRGPQRTFRRTAVGNGKPGGGACLGRTLQITVSTHPADNREGQHLELPGEELLRRARPLPPHDEMVIEDLTDEKAKPSSPQSTRDRVQVARSDCHRHRRL